MQHAQYSPGRIPGFFLFLSLVALPGLAGAQTCNGLPATMVGTDSADSLLGTQGDDVIAALGGDDIVDSSRGNDVVCGGDGSDLLILGEGHDTGFGDGGDDQLRGDAGNDTLDGGAGDDGLRGSDGDDTLAGNTGNDVLIGGADTDACDGTDGIDAADSACEAQSSVDADVFFVSLYADDGTRLDGELYVPINDAAVTGTRRVAWVFRHGAQGSYAAGMPQSAGLWGIEHQFTVLALNGRDWGTAAGGGNTLFEDTTLDMGVGIDFLERLGFEEVFVAGHSGGTQGAGVYPALSENDPRVVGIGLYGVVRDGREAATDVLFVPRETLYDPHIELATQLVAAGEGEVVRDWLTSFGVDLQRSARTFLSYWGPDSRSVVVREITAATVPVLLMRAAGDEFTPDEYSEDVLAAALDAGVDATYVELPYRGPPGGTGVNAHGFLGVEPEMMQTTFDWLLDKVPATGDFVTAIPATADDNYLPTADAGPDREVVTDRDAVVFLDGRNSVDLDGSLTYQWTQVRGRNVRILNATSALAELDVTGNAEDLRFELTVTDEKGATATDDVDVDVETPTPGGGSAADSGLVALLLAVLVDGRRRRRNAIEPGGYGC